MNTTDVPAEVRDRLFLPFAAFPKFKRLAAKAVSHRAACERGAPIQYTSAQLVGGPDGDLRFAISFGQRATMNEFQRIAAESGHVSPPRCTGRMHVAKCAECGIAVIKASVLVEVDHEGRTLTREYDL